MTSGQPWVRRFEDVESCSDDLLLPPLRKEEARYQSLAYCSKLRERLALFRSSTEKDIIEIGLTLSMLERLLG